MSTSLQIATAAACCAFGWATAAHGATASDGQRCSAPPYGDTPAAYQAYMSMSTTIPTRMLTLAITHACEAKFDSKPNVLLAFGSTPEEIAKESTTELAVDFMKGYVRYNATRTARPISVEDFDLHGAEMAQRHDAVKISGAYVQYLKLDFLLANSQAVIAARMSDHPGQWTHIPLLTKEASPNFRARLLSCQKDAPAEEGGCTVTVIGFVTSCEIGTSGRTWDVPCVKVMDGQ